MTHDNERRAESLRYADGGDLFAKDLWWKERVSRARQEADRAADAARKVEQDYQAWKASRRL